MSYSEFPDRDSPNRSTMLPATRSGRKTADGTSIDGLVEAFNAEVGTATQPDSKYNVCKRYAGIFSDRSDHCDAIIAEWFGLVRRIPQMEAYMRRDADVWNPIEKIAARSRTAEEQRAAAWNVVKARYGEARLVRLKEIGNGVTYAKTCSWLAKRVAWPELCRRANRHALDRCNSHTPGQIQTVAILFCDVQRAKEDGEFTGEITEVTPDELETSKATLDSHGLVKRLPSPSGLRPWSKRTKSSQRKSQVPASRRLPRAIPDKGPEHPRRDDCGCTEISSEVLGIFCILKYRQITDAEIQLVLNGLPAPPDELNLCDDHVKALTKALNLDPRPSTDVLGSRIQTCVSQALNWKRLKNQGGSYFWFQDGTSPYEVHTFRGVWKPAAFDASTITKKRICQLIDSKPNAFESFLHRGFMASSGMFAGGVSSFDSGLLSIGEIAAWELEMYLRHGQVDHPEYTGDFHAMYHSLAQQIIRMDLKVWLSHVLTDDCHDYRLLSYPTPVWYRPKGVRPFETLLRYPVDSYIGSNDHPKPISHMGYLFLKEGRSQMRGIYEEFRNPSVFKAWLENLRKGGNHQPQARSQRVIGGTDAPVQPLQLRHGPTWLGGISGVYAVVTATAPEVIHASTADDAPAFVIPNAYIPFDHHPSGTNSACTSEQVRAHLQQLTVPTHTISGTPVVCIQNQDSWPVSYRLRSTSEISGALVGEIPWTHPAVKMELSAIFQGDVDVAKQWIERCRMDLLRQACQAMQVIRNREFMLYENQLSQSNTQQEHPMTQSSISVAPYTPVHSTFQGEPGAYQGPRNELSPIPQASPLHDVSLAASPRTDADAPSPFADTEGIDAAIQGIIANDIWATGSPPLMG